MPPGSACGSSSMAAGAAARSGQGVSVCLQLCWGAQALREGRPAGLAAAGAQPPQLPPPAARLLVDEAGRVQGPAIFKRRHLGGRLDPLGLGLAAAAACLIRRSCRKEGQEGGGQRCCRSPGATGTGGCGPDPAIVQTLSACPLEHVGPPIAGTQFAKSGRSRSPGALALAGVRLAGAYLAGAFLALGLGFSSYSEPLASLLYSSSGSSSVLMSLRLGGILAGSDLRGAGGRSTSQMCVGAGQMGDSGSPRHLGTGVDRGHCLSALL